MGEAMAESADRLTRAIEHTLLRPEATAEQIDRLCDEAWHYGFLGVCVNPVYVRRAAQRLHRNPRSSAPFPRRGGPATADVGRSTTEAARAPSPARPCPSDASPETLVPRLVSVAGFPLGAGLTATKADEARRALDDGADEIDMVVTLGALIDGDHAAVRRDIESVAQVVHKAGRGHVLKVILETAALSRDQVILGCRCAMEGEADYVKTSTGFHPAGGATVEHVRLLHRLTSPMRVKAAGGIRTAAGALAMLEAGADRIGTSSGVGIMTELGRKPPLSESTSS